MTRNDTTPPDKGVLIDVGDVLGGLEGLMNEVLAENPDIAQQLADNAQQLVDNKSNSLPGLELFLADYAIEHASVIHAMARDYQHTWPSQSRPDRLDRFYKISVPLCLLLIFGALVSPLPRCQSTEAALHPVETQLVRASAGDSPDDSDRSGGVWSDVPNDDVPNDDILNDDVPNDDIPNDDIPNDIPDNGAPDTGALDTGALDTGAPDNGAPDTGAPDNGAPDNGAPDTGAPDNGAPDTGAPDNGAPDNGAPDNGAPSNIPDNAALESASAGGAVPIKGTPNDGGSKMDPASQRPSQGPNPGRIADWSAIDDPTTRDDEQEVACWPTDEQIRAEASRHDAANGCQANSIAEKTMSILDKPKVKRRRISSRIK